MGDAVGEVEEVEQFARLTFGLGGRVAGDEGGDHDVFEGRELG